jgi:hypothetical protein
MDPSVVQALVQQAAAAEARLAQIETKIKGAQQPTCYGGCPATTATGQKRPYASSDATALGVTCSWWRLVSSNCVRLT